MLRHVARLCQPWVVFLWLPLCGSGGCSGAKPHSEACAPDDWRLETITAELRDIGLGSPYAPHCEKLVDAEHLQSVGDLERRCKNDVAGEGQHCGCLGRLYQSITPTRRKGCPAALAARETQALDRGCKNEDQYACFSRFQNHQSIEYRCRVGDSPACYELGQRNGSSIKLESACSGGVAAACDDLGGKICPRWECNDVEKKNSAVKFCERACELNGLRGCGRLAQMYSAGSGTTADLQRTKELRTREMLLIDREVAAGVLREWRCGNEQ